MTRLELIMTDARHPLGPDDVQALLKRVERPAAPSDMVAKVRARLAAERAAQTAGAETETETVTAPVPAVPALPPAKEARAGRPWRRWAVEGFVFAAAAAGLVIAVQVGRQAPRGHNPAAEAAGIAAESARVVDVHLRATALDDALVRRLAADAGLRLVAGADGVVLEGGATDMRRFLVQLRVEAARAGGGVSGFVPDAGRLRLTIATE